VPDTLLLAEAFWMMEGYFVRTLGMHRVYNSAFMNMLKREDNQNYRQLIKNTLEFDPDILKRYVNFMNNPDEETAVHQFGKDDKYFGVCIMMSTMPGLPMYGHGQVEGYTEKYGMEYRRAKYNELPDQWLIDRHYREVFPLLHRRAEFAEVENFTLYDFYVEGHVNEDVFAYSNHYHNQGSLFLFNNKFSSTKGWIKRSTQIKDKASGRLYQRDIHDGLRVHGDEKHFVILRDHIAGLDYMRPSRDVQSRGLYFELEAFKYRVFTDIREIYDEDGHLQALYDQIGWQGVPNIHDAKEDLRLMPLHQAFKQFLQLPKGSSNSTVEKVYKEILQQGQDFGLKMIALQETKAIANVLRLFKSLDAYDKASFEPFAESSREQQLMTIALLPLGDKWLETWRLFRLVDGDALALTLKHKKRFTAKATSTSVLSKLIQDAKVRQYLRVNTWQAKTYFNQEGYHALLGSLLSTVWLESDGKRDIKPFITAFAEAEINSSYELNKLVKPSVKKTVAKTKATAKKPAAKTASLSKTRRK
jgi:hypothetical protein